MPVVSIQTASGAGCVFSRSRRSRASSSAVSASSSACVGARPVRCITRRRARSPGSATSHTLSRASGKTAVPMSRPSTTISWAADVARTVAFTQARTCGILATRLTTPVTGSPRIFDSHSAPSSRGSNVVSAGTRVTRWVRSRTERSVHRSGGSPSSSRAAVTARYSDPLSTWRMPRRVATCRAVLDFPDAAGPSMVTTKCVPSDDGTGQLLPETGKRHGGASRVVDDDGAPGNRPEHAEGHCDAVIPVRRDPAGERPARAAAHDKAIVEFLRLGTDGAQVRDDRPDAIAFLDAQLAGPRDPRLSFGAGGDAGEHGQFVDEGRHFAPLDVRTAQVPRRHHHAGHFLATLGAPVFI